MPACDNPDDRLSWPEWNALKADGGEDWTPLPPPPLLPRRHVLSRDVLD